MLEDAKNTIPDELSKRFDLNRFFALQRDVINDELSDNVPDLVEDAMENPTGSYQQVSRFQNEKLMDIDRTTIAIMEMLNLISGKVDKLEKGTSEGDSWWDTIADMLGWGLLGAGRGRGRNPKTNKGPKKTRPNTKPKKSKIPKINLRGNIGKIIAGLVLAGLALSTTDIFSGDETGSEDDSGVNTASMGDFGSMLTDVAAYSAIAASPLAVNKLKNMVTGTKPAAPTIPTAEPKGQQVRRNELPKDHPKYKANGGPKDKYGTAGSFVSAAEAKNYIPTTTPKAPAAPAGIGNRFGKAATGVFSSAGRAATSKGTGLMASAYALYEFYKGVTALDPNLTEQQYTVEVSKLGSAAVAQVGLFMFSTFVSSLIAGTFGAIAGGTVGGVAGSAAAGAGAAPGAAAGAAVGGTFAAISSFVLDVGVYYAIDYFWGEELDEIAKNEEFNKVVAKVVYWLMTSYRTLKEGMQTVSDFVSPDQPATNANLSRADAIIKGRNKQKQTAIAKSNPSIAKSNPSNVTSPKSPMATSGEENSSYFSSETDMQRATKAASQLHKDRKPEEEKTSSFLDWMNPGSMVASMAGSMFGAAGGEFASGLSGMVNNPGVMAMADGLSPSAIFGEGGMSAILGMAGVKALTPDDAAAMGMSPEDAAKFNSEIKPQTVSQAMTPGAGREVNAALAKADPMESINTAIASMGDQFNAANRLTLAQPAATTRGFPQFASTPHPTSTAIVALRAQGMADVYVHPQSGATMERMDRGGETLFG